MCGPETTGRPRGGALAALSPPITTPRGTIHGDLSFHTPGSPGSIRATHARLTPSGVGKTDDISSLYVVIHSSGDLTRKVHDCGLFRRFSLPDAGVTHARPFVELPLESPLSLEVGSDGIIGRRVSLYSRPSTGDDVVLAEGIVGFNFLTQTPSL